MELGVCAAKVRGETLEAKMTALAEIGYDFIEPAWVKEDHERLGEAYGHELAALGKRTGCPVRSAILGSWTDLGARIGTPDGDASERDIATRALETLAAAGGSVLLLPNWAGENAPDYDRLYRDWLHAMGEVASKFKLSLGIEHIPGSKYRNTSVAVCELIEQVNHPSVGVYYDIANGLYADEDTLANAQTVAPHTVQYHVKGCPPQSLTLADMPLSEMRKIFDDAGYRGRVALEDGPRGDEETNAVLGSMLATLKQHGYA